MNKSLTKNQDSPLTGKVTNEVYCRTVTTVLNETYGTLRDATKILARRVEVGSETVRMWLAGRYAPRGAELIRLMAECPALEAAVITLVRTSRQATIDEDTRAFRHLSPIEQEQRLRRDLDALQERLRILDEAENQSRNSTILSVDRRRGTQGGRAHPTGERRLRA